MLKKVISTPGFWKSVFSLGLAFAILFTLFKWGMSGFKSAFFSSLEDPNLFYLGLIVGGFIYGFFVSFGKFRGKIKKDEQRN